MSGKFCFLLNLRFKDATSKQKRKQNRKNESALRTDSCKHFLMHSCGFCTFKILHVLYTHILKIFQFFKIRKLLFDAFILKARAQKVLFELNTLQYTYMSTHNLLITQLFAHTLSGNCRKRTIPKVHSLFKCVS